MFAVCSFHYDMQMEFPFSVNGRLVKIHEALLQAFGRPPPAIRLDPPSQLVLSMLSSRTREPIAKAAFARLANAFCDWRLLARAPPEKIERLIRPVTHYERKAVFLSASLQRIMVLRHELSLEFLSDWPVEDALAWLMRLPGVGPKISAAALNFSPLHKRTLVVDTAHYRTAMRVGLLPSGTSFHKAAQLMMRDIPDNWTANDLEDHHSLMQHLGKSCCHYANPFCEACPVRNHCDSATKQRRN